MSSPPTSSPAVSDTLSGVPAPQFGDDLDSRHSGDFLRLERLLEHGDGFQLVFAACVSVAYRQLLIERIDALHPSAAVLDLSSRSDPSALLEGMRQIGPQHQPIHLFGIEAWLRRAGPEALRALNYRRETLAADTPSTLVLWVEPATIPIFASEAPDLWAWRTAVLDLSHPSALREAVHDQTLFLGSAERARREQRLAEISDHLKTVSKLSGADAGLLLEASHIEESLGDVEAARDRATAARAIFRGLDDRFGEARAAGRIAGILQSRGELDEALRIRKEEELPVYERLGDVRSKAVTMGQIADILEARGQLDEALRIRQEEQLLVYERLGDVRSKAVTMGQIADILEARGQLDEALRIRQKEELPVYERLGDAREKAVTMGKIADVLQARGQLDEALRIRQKEELPVYEHLGEVREKVVTMGKIADILQARGQLDEALALHELRLPIAQRLGHSDVLAHIRYSTASLRLRRGENQTGGLQTINGELAGAFAISVQLGRPDAIGAIGQLLAQVLAMGGQCEQALVVLAQAEDAYAKLDDAKGLAHVRALQATIGAA